MGVKVRFRKACVSFEIMVLSPGLEPPTVSSTDEPPKPPCLDPISSVVQSGVTGGTVLFINHVLRLGFRHLADRVESPPCLAPTGQR